MRALALGLGLLFAISSSAFANEYDINGTTCVPTDATIPLYGALSRAVGVTWPGTSAGTLIFYCAIPVNVANPSNLWFSYTCTTSPVQVEYVKMNKSTGVLTSVDTLTGGCSMDWNSNTFSDTYDIGNYIYFLRVTMTRSSGSDNQEFIGATIW
jgi:hypothetical protein